MITFWSHSTFERGSSVFPNISHNARASSSLKTDRLLSHWTKCRRHFSPCSCWSQLRSRCDRSLLPKQWAMFQGHLDLFLLSIRFRNQIKWASPLFLYTPQSLRANCSFDHQFTCREASAAVSHLYSFVLKLVLYLIYKFSFDDKHCQTVWWRIHYYTIMVAQVASYKSVFHSYVEDQCKCEPPVGSVM